MVPGLVRQKVLEKHEVVAPEQGGQMAGGFGFIDRRDREPASCRRRPVRSAATASPRARSSSVRSRTSASRQQRVVTLQRSRRRACSKNMGG
ncbi:hypothetical protein [Rhodothermus marinus]|uniref:hypothetical protein n=1 Tax=Rhodothermus marinus TaxID=29549 RepID=UPI001FB1AFCB|nr:hypothetical protein [Rhodothermus marinus]